jgi:hypothetical protein
MVYGYYLSMIMIYTVHSWLKNQTRLAKIWTKSVSRHAIDNGKPYSVVDFIVRDCDPGISNTGLFPNPEIPGLENWPGIAIPSYSQDSCKFLNQIQLSNVSKLLKGQ